MGDVRAFVLAIGAVLIGLGLLIGWINYKIDKLKEEDKLNIETIGSIIALEKAMKKLNEALRTESRSLSNYKQRLRCLERRIDILESGHPDSEFDYATTDDDGNALEVWFNGKKYVPEDKRSEDTNTFYADNKVVAETTRPEEKRCCATCRHYRPGPDHTCTIRPWLHVTKEYATNAHSTCNNYKIAYAPTKGQVDCPYIAYKNMGGNGKTEQLLKRAERLDYIYSTGLISIATYRNMMEEFMQNDS